MNIKEKKGLSPVVATVLLISIALVLAIIIWLWALAFLDEKIEKFDEPIENACDDVSFIVDASIDTNGDLVIDIQNKGNVALHGFEVKVKEGGSIDSLKKNIITVTVGASRTGIVIPSGSVNLDNVDEVIIIPLLVGEGDDGKKEYTCDDSTGVSVVI